MAYEYDFGDSWEHEDIADWIGGKFDPDDFAVLPADVPQYLIDHHRVCDK